MRRREITSSLFWMIVGLILTVWSATYPLGNLAQPGTGFLPLGLGVLLLIFSTVLLVRAFKMAAAKEEKEKVRMLPERWPSLATTVLVLIACVFLFEKVGYLLIFFVTRPGAPTARRTDHLEALIPLRGPVSGGRLHHLCVAAEAAAANRLSRKVMHGFF